MENFYVMPNFNDESLKNIDPEILKFLCAFELAYTNTAMKIEEENNNDKT